MKRWPTKLLSELSETVMGQAPPGNESNFEGKGTPFVKAGEFGDCRPIIREWTTKPLKFAKSSDVLVCVVGATCGKLNLGADCAIGRSVAALRPNPSLLDQGFLYAFLQGWTLRLRGNSQGSAQGVITRDMLGAIPIPMPPLSEQARIAKLLEEANELRKLRAQADHRTSNLIPALFHEMFGDVRTSSCRWPTENLGSLITIEAMMVDPREASYQDLPHIGPDRIERNSGKLLASKSAREDGLISTKFLFDERDVLYSKIRPNLRKVALPESRGLCSADMYPVRPGQRLIREFLWAYFLTDYFTDRAVDLSARANMPKLNRVQLESICAPVPPVSLQKEFAHRVTEIRELETIQTASSCRLDDLFKSMQHRAFNGEL
jgi:type I restriction enzyme, S subunit